MRLIRFDRSGTPLGDIPLPVSAVRTRQLDGTDTLDVDGVGSVNEGDRIVYREPAGEWAEWVVRQATTTRDAGLPVTSIACDASWTELKDTFIEDRRNRGATARACLSKALEGTRWTVGTVEETGTGTADLSFYHESAYQAVTETAEKFGLEIVSTVEPDATGNRIGVRTISLVKRRGRDLGKRFEYGQDLQTVKRTIDSSGIITRLYAYGKGVQNTDSDGDTTAGYGRKLDMSAANNGLTYVEDAEATARWGIPGADGTPMPVAGSVDFPECDDAKQLVSLAKARLAQTKDPAATYTLDVTALGRTGLSQQATGLGDTIAIIDRTFTPELRLQGRVTKIEEDLAGGEDSTRITIGNVTDTWTRRQNDARQIIDALASDRPAVNNTVANLIRSINELMNATGGWVYETPGQGISVYDAPLDSTPGPTQCIQIGGGYWRCASSKTADGNWDFKTLADGRGLYANTLFTGRISDAQGLNHWDLDTGEFALAATSTVGGRTVDDIAGGKVAALDSRLDQREVFDRLTGGGATQGIWLKDGRLYLNGTWLTTGVITDKTGANKWDLDSGAMTVTGILQCGTDSGERTVLAADGSISGYINQVLFGGIEWVQVLKQGTMYLRGPRIWANEALMLDTPMLRVRRDDDNQGVGWTGTLTIDGTEHRFVNGIMTS